MTSRRRLLVPLALSLGLSGTLAAAAFFQRSRPGPAPPVAPSVEAWGRASRAPFRYLATDLGALPGSPATLPRDINNAGQVVGDAERVRPPFAARFRSLVRPLGIDLDPPPRTTAFLWERGRMRRLAGLNANTESHAFAINDRGEVAGASETFVDMDGALVPAMRACLWRGGGRGKPRELGTLGGPWSMAYALNDRGQVVGVSHTAGDAETYPFLWQDGTLRRLGDEPGYAKAINDRGEVAGDAPGHLFLWSGGARRKLPGLGGENNRVGAMNDRGQIVGAATFAPRGDPVADLSALTAFVWDGRRARHLPASGSVMEARDVNNHGDVVGSATDRGGRWRAVLYRSGVLYDLQGLLPPKGDDGWLLEDAFAVNDRGQVVGVGRFGPRRERRAFLLTPTR